MELKAKSFTTKFNWQVRELTTMVDISYPAEVQSKRFVAIRDTGATGSCITQQIIDELGLKSIGFCNVGGVSGMHRTEKYKIDLVLPNGVYISGLTVIRCASLGVGDVLIGMDIIAKWDLAISHDELGNMLMSFVIPPQWVIDFSIK